MDHRPLRQTFAGFNTARCVRVLAPVVTCTVITVITAFAAPPARGDECDRLPPPSVAVRRVVTPISIDATYGHRELAALAAKLDRKTQQVLGLTRGTASVKFETRLASIVDRSGRWECASPQLVVSYSFSPMTVYLAKELPAGSCAYREVYQHEMQHVRIYEQHLLSIEGELTATLRQRFATGAPWRNSVGQTSITLQREFEDRWLPYLKREIARVESAQAVIDTPEEYARVAERCNGEFKRLMR